MYASGSGSTTSASGTVKERGCLGKNLADGGPLLQEGFGREPEQSIRARRALQTARSRVRLSRWERNLVINLPYFEDRNRFSCRAKGSHKALTNPSTPRVAAAW